jgi:hypothetical protein
MWENNGYDPSELESISTSAYVAKELRKTNEDLIMRDTTSWAV